MSRVERTRKPSEPRGSQQLRQAERGRGGDTPQRNPNSGHTPTKAEGEVDDVEEALRRQQE
ncbi:MAG: hypothetical protein ACXW31_16555 [Thermoanaerobaculia bacterium]